MVEFGPASSEGDGRFHADGIPTSEAVLLEEELAVKVGFLREEWGDGFGAGGIGDSSEGANFWRGPGGTLMGEGEWLVVVEGVDDVGLGEGLELHEVIEA